MHTKKQKKERGNVDLKRLELHCTTFAEIHLAWGHNRVPSQQVENIPTWGCLISTVFFLNGRLLFCLFLQDTDINSQIKKSTQTNSKANFVYKCNSPFLLVCTFFSSARKNLNDCKIHSST